MLSTLPCIRDQCSWSERRSCLWFLRSHGATKRAGAHSIGLERHKDKDLAAACPHYGAAQGRYKKASSPLSGVSEICDGRMAKHFVRYVRATEGKPINVKAGRYTCVYYRRGGVADSAVSGRADRVMDLYTYTRIHESGERRLRKSKSKIYYF